MNIKNNVMQVNQQIEALHPKQRVHIVAATKYVNQEIVEELVDNGIHIMGENRAESLLEKKQKMKRLVKWHLIGTLQSRKVRDVINEIECLHSLDRLSLAKEINKHRQDRLDCFIQVNVSGEESKHGIHPDELQPFIKQLKQYDKINVIGLMTMAPNTEDQQLVRSCFSRLRELQEQIQAEEISYAPCTELSMGMSNDYNIAIEEGATYIRLGSVLFQ
ncbi:MAG TPA: YggS family pyridoxal phosphate-dependent enzyme [Firmicutes bacterium]|nr:YggS family pyridoxal phosphate-dependent enzyme [Bacillota bacterium]